MKAFIARRYSKVDKLEMVDLPEPVVNDNEVLIQIHAASINLIDSKLKSGEFKLILPYKLPLILGHDVAGVVTKTGYKVSRFKVGDEVFAQPAVLKIGTLAEYIAINETNVALKPQNISMEEAASIPLVGLTAWQALIEKANLKKGQKVFIQAGSGGVGTFAIQLAKHVGATVATTTSETNFDLVKRLGADVVIDYKRDDFETMLKDYDVVLNSQDTKSLEKSLRILKPNGKVISISGPPDVGFAKQMNTPWFLKFIMKLLSFGINRKAKRLGVDYSFLFMRANGNQLTEIASLINNGAIKPVLDKVFTFEQANEALTYVEAGRTKGKVVVKVK
ncbi:MAG: NADP-dependent oxidoreductase [Chitinophagales bacterium]|jgi:NADPH:quinone reductase-like Zn-dependent oxidoreductase|nr:NADP-dependent oxidoreductase [Bacteroidota bacterium]MBL0280724.1 NADP-dependent oxidoreductase [Bacteroidota bacterium]MBP9880769.1 NADP-dependent oxidoreductase [Chitinophagales bacterium]